MIKDKKILEIETVGSQDRPINEEDRKAFEDYFRKRKEQRGKRRIAAANKNTKSRVTN